MNVPGHARGGPDGKDGWHHEAVRPIARRAAFVFSRGKTYIIIKKILDRLDEKEELKAAEDPAAEA